MFGTVVDWRGSIVAEGQALGSLHGIQADWETFADGWRARYQSALGPEAELRGRCACPWAGDGVVPLAMPVMAGERHGAKLGIADLDPGRVGAPVKLGADP
jgi:hypothetical protein